MALWIELGSIFDSLYRSEVPPDEAVRPFFQLARRCFESGGSEAATAVACAFYEHLLLKPSVRADLPRWISRADFLASERIFSYHLNESEFAAFRDEFLAASARFAQR